MCHWTMGLNSDKTSKVFFVLILTMADQLKVVYDLSNGAIFSDLERPIPGFKVTPFFDTEYLRNGTR